MEQIAACRLRSYQPSDLLRIRQAFDASGFGYEFPDLDSDPLFLTKVVLTDDNDSPVMGVAVRLEGNAYAWLDNKWGTPSERWAAFRELHEAAKGEASVAGLDTLCCQLPPSIEKSFGRRLRTVGWRPLNWNTWVTRI